MKCPVCGVELLIYGMRAAEDGEPEAEYVCRNKRCAAFDKRLQKAEEKQPSAQEESNEQTAP